jgi:hypothetical protein
VETHKEWQERTGVGAFMKRWRKERAADRKAARGDQALIAAAWDELREAAVHGQRYPALYARHAWRSVSSMRAYLAQHFSGMRGTPYGRLIHDDQSTVVRCILERFVREGKAEKAIGEGVRGGDCLQYRAIL